MREAWAAAGPGLPAYELLLPGSASFVCLVGDCPSHCCKIFSVSLNEREVDRLRFSSGLQPVHFLESEDGEPITLPLAQPYLLARRDGQCALLAPDLACGQYEGRPDSCRLYPHFVLFFDPATGSLKHGDIEGMQASLRAALRGSPGEGPFVPLLVRHLGCPGFSGVPLSEAEWSDLLDETGRLQYSEAGGVSWAV